MLEEIVKSCPPVPTVQVVHQSCADSEDTRLPAKTPSGKTHEESKAEKVRYLLPFRFFGIPWLFPCIDTYQINGILYQLKTPIMSIRTSVVHIARRKVHH